MGAYFSFFFAAGNSWPEPGRIFPASAFSNQSAIINFQYGAAKTTHYEKKVIPNPPKAREESFPTLSLPSP
jgi:hypothetical protein